MKVHLNRSSLSVTVQLHLPLLTVLLPLHFISAKYSCSKLNCFSFPCKMYKWFIPTAEGLNIEPDIAVHSQKNKQANKKTVVHLLQ